MNSTSMFDPVLCEIIYKWYCPTNGKIIDCFAGGAVRGLMAYKFGYSYIGIDLSRKQIEVYSDDNRDISNMNIVEFEKTYKMIVCY